MRDDHIAVGVRVRRSAFEAAPSFIGLVGVITQVNGVVFWVEYDDQDLRGERFGHYRAPHFEAIEDDAVLKDRLAREAHADKWL